MSWRDRFGNVVEGGLSGASVGGTIGSFAGQPGAGAAVGGFIGGVAGGFADTSQQEMARRMVSGEVDPVARSSPVPRPAQAIRYSTSRYWTRLRAARSVRLNFRGWRDG